MLSRAIGVGLGMIENLPVLIKAIQLDPGMIEDHLVSIRTIHNIFEFDQSTIEGHLVLHPKIYSLYQDLDLVI